MNNMSDEQALAIIAVEVKHIREDVAELRDDMRLRDAYYVPRDLYDAQVARTRAELARMDAVIRAKRVSWTSVSAIVISGLAVLITLIQNIP